MQIRFRAYLSVKGFSEPNWERSARWCPLGFFATLDYLCALCRETFFSRTSYPRKGAKRKSKGRKKIFARRRSAVLDLIRAKPLFFAGPAVNLLKLVPPLSLRLDCGLKDAVSIFAARSTFCDFSPPGSASSKTSRSPGRMNPQIGFAAKPRLGPLSRPARAWSLASLVLNARARAFLWSHLERDERERGLGVGKAFASRLLCGVCVNWVTCMG
jgi:hypothetical protein